MVRKSSFVIALVFVLGLVGCHSSASSEVTTSADGTNTTVTGPDGSKTKVTTSTEGTNTTVTGADGKTATMSTDANGTTKIKSAGGTAEVGSGAITEEDLGIVVYPGATEIPHKGSKIEAGGKKIVMAQFETTDAPEKVVDFYASKIKVSGSVVKSGDLNMVAGTLPSGAHVTVSAKIEDGKTHINVGTNLEIKK
jgi:hypothetical protein